MIASVRTYACGKFHKIANTDNFENNSINGRVDVCDMENFVENIKYASHIIDEKKKDDNSTHNGKKNGKIWANWLHNKCGNASYKRNADDFIN